MPTEPPPGQEAGAGHEAVQLAHVTLRKKTTRRTGNIGEESIGRKMPEKTMIFKNSKPSIPHQCVPRTCGEMGKRLEDFFCRVNLFKF